MLAMPGLLIDRHGRAALALHYAAGSCSSAPSLFKMSYASGRRNLFAGLTIVSAKTGANASAGKLYPARMRTSGIGWALGIGRLGGIAAPALGGYLLLIGLPPREIFLSACGFALIAAISAALLAFRGERLIDEAGATAGNEMNHSSLQ